MAKRKKDNVIDTKKEEKKEEKVQLTSQGEQFEKALFVQRFLAFLLDIVLVSYCSFFYLISFFRYGFYSKIK